MPSKRDKASENPYETDFAEQRKSPARSRHFGVIVVIFGVSFGLSMFFAPADPYSVYLTTAVLALLGSLAYWVGLLNGRTP